MSLPDVAAGLARETPGSEWGSLRAPASEAHAPPSSLRDLPRTQGGAVMSALVHEPTATRPEPVPAAGAGVIVADHLSKRFGKVVAVDDLSFSLEHGTITGFLGPNGAGKTTTLRMLLGLTKPTSGNALLFGRQLRRRSEPGAPGRCGARGDRLPPWPLRPRSSGDARRRRWAPGSTGRRGARLGGACARAAGVASAATRWACGSGSVSRPRCSATRSC